MKRILAAILALITLFTTLALTSCGKDDGAPEGMQLVRGGADVGYNFWGPEEWIIANVGDISCTYASKIDLSSMTFTETAMPEGTVEEYFESEKIKFPYEITVSTAAEDCLFGNAAGLAKKYVYSYTYKDFSYTCMQIFVTHASSFYIFTYTASNNTRTGGQSYYEFYLDKVTASIDAFEFTAKTEDEYIEDYKRDESGYILVSNKTLCGFTMYVPDSYKVDYSSAMVSVSHSDGTNITMSQATYTGVTNADYWNARKESISAFADKVTDPESGATVTTLKEIEIEKRIDLPDTRWALVYEYTYALDGVDYHVYQVLIVASATDGYVFTYIASEENYQKHYDEMEKVLYKISY